VQEAVALAGSGAQADHVRVSAVAVDAGEAAADQQMTARADHGLRRARGLGREGGDRVAGGGADLGAMFCTAVPFTEEKWPPI